MSRLPRIVLLPGLDGTGDLFADFAENLRGKADAQIIRYPVDRPLGYDKLLELIQAQLPLEPFVLLGESFSGPLALRIAAQNKWPIHGVILCASFARYPLWWVAPISFVLRAPGVMTFPQTRVFRSLMRRRIGTELLEQMNAANAKVQPEVIRARINALLRTDASSDLRSIERPILYMRAQFDNVVPAGACRHILRQRPQVRVIDFPCSHYVLQTMPRESAEAVTKFCQELA